MGITYEIGNYFSIMNASPKRKLIIGRDNRNLSALALTRPLHNVMYPLRRPIKKAQAALASTSYEEWSAKEWHDKLGHIAADRLQLMPLMCKGVPKMERNKLKDPQCVP